MKNEITEKLQRLADQVNELKMEILEENARGGKPSQQTESMLDYLNGATSNLYRSIGYFESANREG